MTASRTASPPEVSTGNTCLEPSFRRDRPDVATDAVDSMVGEALEPYRTVVARALQHGQLGGPLETAAAGVQSVRRPILIRE